jgi:RimJ/RimL family protein N-acetyltransferase
MLVVETEGEIIGEISVRGGQRAANRHVVGLGIDVRKEWRDQGLGTALMRRAMEWARATGIVRRIELEVFVHNTRALHVYEKLGFKVEGRKEQAYYRDGQYIDAFMMALLLNPGGDRSTEQR